MQERESERAVHGGWIGGGRGHGLVAAVFFVLFIFGSHTRFCSRTCGTEPRGSKEKDSNKPNEGSTKCAARLGLKTFGPKLSVQNFADINRRRLDALADDFPVDYITRSERADSVAPMLFLQRVPSARSFSTTSSARLSSACRWSRCLWLIS